MYNDDNINVLIKERKKIVMIATECSDMVGEGQTLLLLTSLW